MSSWYDLAKKLGYRGKYTSVNDAISSWADSQSSSKWYDKLLSRLSDVFDSLVNRYTGADLTNAEREASALQLQNQRVLNEEDFQRKIDFYEMYESPEAQMRQYKAAGLNPALMYGNGASVSASGGVGTGSAQSVASSTGELSGLISALSGIPMKLREMNINRALRDRELDIEEENVGVARERVAVDKMLAESSVPKNLADTERILQDIEVSKFDLQLKKDLRELTIEHQRNSNNMQYMSMALSSSQIKDIDSRIENRMHQNRYFSAQITKLLADASMVNYQISTYLPQMLENSTNLSDAQVFELNQQTENLKVTQDKIGAEIKKISADTQLSEKDIQYYIWNHSHPVAVGPLRGNEVAKPDSKFN